MKFLNKSIWKVRDNVLYNMWDELQTQSQETLVFRSQVEYIWQFFWNEFETRALVI